MSDVRTLSNHVNISVEKTKTIIKIAQGHSGLHYIQYKIPLTEERRFFFLEIIKIGKKKTTICLKTAHKLGNISRSYVLTTT